MSKIIIAEPISPIWIDKDQKKHLLSEMDNEHLQKAYWSIQGRRLKQNAIIFKAAKLDEKLESIEKQIREEFESRKQEYKDLDQVRKCGKLLSNEREYRLRKTNKQEVE